MTREAVHVLVGDLHAGSKLAPLVPCTDTDGISYGPGPTQAWLLHHWRKALAETKALAKGCVVKLHLGGDLVDGVAHHKSTQTLLDHNDQRALAVELLRPWVNIASYGYGLLGTDAHVEDNGQEDKSVCKELGIKADGFWRLECSGKLLDWAHHTSVSRKVWLRENGGVGLANKTYAECREAEPPERVPDMIVRHHVHLFTHTLAKGIQVVTVPGWKAQDSHVRRFDPNGPLTVGVVLWFPSRNEVKQLLYPFPPKPIVSAEKYGKLKVQATAAA